MTPWWASALGVSLGATCGAWLRWQASVWLNPLWPGFPLGTLSVNLIGGFLAGVAYVVFGRMPNETWRLLLVTGGLGGLTTFSSFSAESLALIEKGRLEMAMAHSVAHVLGALACAALGARLTRWIWV